MNVTGLFFLEIKLIQDILRVFSVRLFLLIDCTYINEPYEKKDKDL